MRFLKYTFNRDSNRALAANFANLSEYIIIIMDSVIYSEPL